MSLPKKITIETILLKDMVMMCLTAILNVDVDKVIWHLRTLDGRIISGKLSIHECSIQIQNGYKKYLEYLPLIDTEYYEKTKKYR